MTTKKLPIAVLASGRGSNFKAIVNGIIRGEVNAEVKVLITNNPKAGAIKIAKRNGIPAEIVELEKFGDREEFELKIKEILDRNGAQLVVLAGYMLLLKSKALLGAYRNKIINIHPALLPAFPGVHAQKQAFDYGVKISGLTIHFVDEQLDHGPIIFQKPVDISECKSVEEVEERILKSEHGAYKKVVDSFSKGIYVIEGRKTRFIPYQ